MMKPTLFLLLPALVLASCAGRRGVSAQREVRTELHSTELTATDGGARSTERTVGADTALWHRALSDTLRLRLTETRRTWHEGDTLCQRRTVALGRDRRTALSDTSSSHSEVAANTATHWSGHSERQDSLTCSQSAVSEQTKGARRTGFAVLAALAACLAVLLLVLAVRRR